MDIGIIQIYAPIERKITDFLTEFTKRKTLDSIKETTVIIIIMEHWNVRIGDDVNNNLGCRGDEEQKTTNRSGLKMFNFCKSISLLNRNTFRKQTKQERDIYVMEGQNTKKSKLNEQREEDVHGKIIFHRLRNPEKSEKYRKQANQNFRKLRNKIYNCVNYLNKLYTRKQKIHGETRKQNNKNKQFFFQFF